MIKAVLLDFDGTLVRRDILDAVCGIVGKEEESERINREFHEGKSNGITALITRINFLKGITTEQIEAKLAEEAFLVPGAQELLRYLNEQNIVSILNSGNILPVLHAYQQMLGITYVVGTSPLMRENIIEGISAEQFSSPNFKLDGIKSILDRLSIDPQQTVAIGDSPADKQVFEFADKSIAIYPKGGVEQYADYIIKGDLTEAIPIIREMT